MQVWHVGLGDHHRRADGDRGRPLRVHAVVVDPGLQGGHGLLQHLLVEFVADLLDVAGLLVAKQVARAADVQVVRGELEARASVSSDCSTLSRRSACAVRVRFAGTVKSA